MEEPVEIQTKNEKRAFSFSENVWATSIGALKRKTGLSFSDKARAPSSPRLFDVFCCFLLPERCANGGGQGRQRKVVEACVAFAFAEESWERSILRAVFVFLASGKYFLSHKQKETAVRFPLKIE